MAFSISVTSTLNQAALEEELQGEGGSVSRFGQGIATAITRLAKSYSPVDTGALQASISTRTDRAGAELSWVVSANTTYAEYQESGYYHNRGGNWIEGKHFLESAGYEVLSQYS
jgi:hypothetical protein